MNVVTPHALITTEALQPRLKRGGSAEDDVEQRLTDAINGATMWMEQFTRRKLRARNHRTVSTIFCTASSGSTAIAGTGFTAGVEAGDDMVGSGLAIGSQVESVTSNSALVATRKTTDVVGGLVMFGSRPLRVSGNGDAELYLPERPLVECFSCYSDVGGVLAAIDMTGAYIDYEVGRIVLATTAFPKGNLNIVVNARCGYVQPSATDLGHPEWMALEAAALRVAEIFYTDALHVRGRYEDTAIGNLSARVSTSAMPADVIGMLLPFLRRW